MLRVVADTNVLISAVIAEGNEYQLLKLAKAGKIRIITSPQIIKELRGVISRQKFRFSEEQINAIVKQIISISEIVVTKTSVSVIKEDPADDRILEAALDGKADYIASGDKDLLSLKEFRGIKIRTSKDFLEGVDKMTTRKQGSVRRQK